MLRAAARVDGRPHPEGPAADTPPEGSGKAVGTPFVGPVAACLVLSEVLRLPRGGPMHQVVEMGHRGIEHRSVVGRAAGPEDFNPGFVRVASSG